MSIKEIISTAAEIWDVTDEQVTGAQNHDRYWKPRSAAVVIATEAGYAASYITRAFNRSKNNFVATAVQKSRIYSNDCGYAHDIKELRELLGPVAAEEPPNPFDGFFEVNVLIASVARDFGLSAEFVLSKSRLKPAVMARAVIYKILSERAWSSTAIARRFGRDHSTILFALENFDIYARYSPKVAKVYKAHCKMRDEARA